MAEDLGTQIRRPPESTIRLGSSAAAAPPQSKVAAACTPSPICCIADLIKDDCNVFILSDCETLRTFFTSHVDGATSALRLRQTCQEHALIYLARKIFQTRVSLHHLHADRSSLNAIICTSSRTYLLDFIAHRCEVWRFPINGVAKSSKEP